MTMIRPRSDVVYGIYRGLPSAAHLLFRAHMETTEEANSTECNNRKSALLHPSNNIGYSSIVNRICHLGNKSFEKVLSYQISF